MSITYMAPCIQHNGARSATPETEIGLDLFAELTDADLEQSVSGHSPVVRTALTLSLREPIASALDVLDRAIKAHEADDLDFAFDVDELELPHPFAELVRRAFAPHVRPEEINGWTDEIDDAGTLPRAEAAWKEWNLALLRFAERYGIWKPSAE